MFRFILIGGVSLVMAACQTTSSLSSKSEAYSYTPIQFESAKATAADTQRCEASGGVVRRIKDTGADRCLTVCPSEVKTKMGARFQAPCSAGEADLTCKALLEEGRSLIACVD